MWKDIFTHIILFNVVSDKIRKDQIQKIKNEFKGNILSIMSHNLKTQLNAMNLYS